MSVGTMLSVKAISLLLCVSILANAFTLPEIRKTQKVVPFDGSFHEYFGVSVGVLGDVMVVGADYDNDNGTNSGSAYVYIRNDGSWEFLQKLYAPDAAAHDNFGWSVAIAKDTIVVGSYRDNVTGISSGSAYVYAKNEGTYDFVTKLVPFDGAAQDFYGRIVAISDGVIVVGSHQDDDNGTNSGSAYVYAKNGGTYDLVTKLVPSDGEARNEFGQAVAISNEILVIGAPRNGRSGSAYVYTKIGGTWEFLQKLLAPDAAAFDEFGWSVAISEDVIVVGSRQDDANGTHSGSAYVYTKIGGTWEFLQKLLAPDAAAFDEFGWSVAISGNSIVVGASKGDHFNGSNSGSAYVYAKNGATYAFVTKLHAYDAASGDHFGWWVAISGNTIAVGAINDDDNGTSSGSVYAYTFCPSKLVLDGGLCVCPIADQVFNGVDCVACENGELPNKEKSACVSASVPLEFMLDVLF